MKKKLVTKIVSCALVSIMAISLMACGSKSNNSNNSNSNSGGSNSNSESSKEDAKTTISLYTTIPGKDKEFEALCDEFMKANPNITVNYIAYDSSEKQKWMTLYASGEAPTVAVMDPVDIRENKENMLPYDSSADTWMDKIDSAYLDVFKSDDGKIYGIPNSVQAMGILYNKTTIEKATGEKFDPSTIKSTSDLAALCEKIKKGGVSPIMFTGVDWSLGSHYLSQVFTGIRGTADQQLAFINDLKAGKVDLKKDAAWNSVMGTFDVIAKYNYNSSDPLVGNTDIDGQAMAKGDVAMWFMGDWGWSYLSKVASADDEYGIMPCPLTDNPKDAINQQLGVFPSKGYSIDASHSDAAQQAAGKKLVEYLCFGNQQAMADLLQVALPYKDSKVTYSSPIVQSTQSYIQNQATYSTYAFSLLLPSDFWSENGAVMQRYLVKEFDRDKAAGAIQDYWKAQNNK